VPDRGHHDRATIEAILDEGFVCHVTFAVGNQPYAIPTAYVRSGDEIFVHGSAASRMMRLGEGGCAVCVTVTLVDVLVLAPVPADDLSPSLAGVDVTRVRCAKV
jgi:nitroimidazol reductase NimA-like FMN-containing flavoprotein (pyridoxamine 5'-phosphate oxidase superfamily)